jgi:hypothetical protein
MPGGGGDNLLPTIVSQSYGKPLNPIIVPVGTTFTLFFHGIVTPTYEGQYELGFDWYSGSYFDADPYANPLGSGSVSMVVYPGGVYDPDPPISTPLYYNDYTGSTITLSASLVNGDTYVYWMRLSQSMTPLATLEGGYAYGQDVYVTFTGSASTGSEPPDPVSTNVYPPIIISQSISITTLTGNSASIFVDAIWYGKQVIASPTPMFIQTDPYPMSILWYSGSSSGISQSLNTGSMFYSVGSGIYFADGFNYSYGSTTGSTYTTPIFTTSGTRSYFAKAKNDVSLQDDSSLDILIMVEDAPVPPPPPPPPKGSWKGNPSNPVPNPAQQDKNLSDSRIVENRALNIRRDTDKLKNFSVTLKDIDETVFGHLEKMQLTVVDAGNHIKVPVSYASPEKWKSVRNDGFMRDNNGKIILPALIFYRVSSGSDKDMMTFNKYLRYPVIKKYSEKNQYTKYSLLEGKNTPLSEMYNVVMPDHMVFNYKFIIWTEYIEQNNALIERINFETNDYWGSERGFRFRTFVDNYSHTTEVQSEKDRLIKTEFDLSLRGYLLPDQFAPGLDGFKATTEKMFSKKKVIFGIETKEGDWKPIVDEKTNDRWRSQNFPNITLQDELTLRGLTVTVSNEKEVENFKTVLQVITETVPGDCWHFPPPENSSDPGTEGWQSYDTDYYYLYGGGIWKRVPLVLFNDFGQIF